MDILIARVLIPECPGVLEDLVKSMKENPEIAKAVEDDAQRFVNQYCRWIRSPCPQVLFDTLQNGGLYKDIINIVASYSDTVHEQLTNIFGNIPSDYNTTLDDVMPRFNQAVEESTCFIPDLMERIHPQDRLLHMCIYLNEMVPISLDEKELRGTILCLGRLAVQPSMEGDCCLWASVAGKDSTRLVGESYKNFTACTNALMFISCNKERLTEDTEYKDEEDGEVMFKHIIDKALEEECKYLSPRLDIIEQIMWIREKFKSVEEIQAMLNNLNDKYEEEEAAHIQLMRIFIRYSIMNAVYNSDEYPLFPPP